MFTNSFLVFAFFKSVLVLENQLNYIECSELHTHNHNDLYEYPVVYRRFIRRRPPMHPHDRYMDEIVEIFHTKEKPPAFRATMTDEDVDKFIFCDFNRELDECKKYWESQKSGRPTTSTTSTSTSNPITTTMKPKTTTSKSESSTTITEIGKIPDLEKTEADYSYYNEKENDDYYVE